MLVDVKNLRHTYTQGVTTINVLNSLNLEVAPGEFISIMGASGSGKSTLLHILGCLTKPREGTYRLGETDVFSVTSNELASIRAQQIGFVFQMFHLLPAMSVLENVKLPFLYNNTPAKTAHERALEALQQVGLSSRTHHKPMELSGGEMQRAAIARALAVNPELILADEPTGNLDSKTSLEILTLFQKLHTNGRTIIMVTHDKDVAHHAERNLFLQDGTFQ